MKTKSVVLAALVGVAAFGSVVAAPAAERIGRAEVAAWARTHATLAKSAVVSAAKVVVRVLVAGARS